MNNKEDSLKEEIKETIAISNKIIGFYEELIEAQNEQIESLQCEVKGLQSKIVEARILLRDTFKTQHFGIIN